MVKKTSWLVLLVLLSILLVGIYMRTVSVLETAVIMPLRADAGSYFTYAYNLRHKQTYSAERGNLKDLKSPVLPDALRYPGYPLFLAVFVDGLPDNEMIKNIMLFQALISVLTLILAFFLFRNFLPALWGATAALLVALSPHLISANTFVLTETLFCFWIVFLAFLMGLFAKKKALYLILIIGITTGIAVLIRPSIQYFFIPMAFFLIFHCGFKKGATFAAVFILGCAFAFGPWIVRNMITLGKATDKTLMINFLHHGIYPDFVFDGFEESYGFPYRFDPRSREISKDLSSVLQEIAGRFDREPWKHLKWFVLKKPVAFWSWDIVNGAGDIFPYPVSKSPYFTRPFFRQTHQIMYRVHGSLAILGLIGAVLVWFPLSRAGVTEDSVLVLRFVSLFLLYYTLIHMVGVPFPRYSIPLRPFLYGMAAFVPHLLVTALRKP